MIVPIILNAGTQNRPRRISDEFLMYLLLWLALLILRGVIVHFEPSCELGRSAI
jgi:hypothetical protein